MQWPRHHDGQFWNTAAYQEKWKNPEKTLVCHKARASVNMRCVPATEGIKAVNAGGYHQTVFVFADFPTRKTLKETAHRKQKAVVKLVTCKSRLLLMTHNSFRFCMFIRIVLRQINLYR